MELVAVMAIMGVMAAIAVPNMISWRLNRDFTSSLQKTVSMMNRARLVAVKENKPTVILFDIAENHSRAFVDTSGDRAWNPKEDRQIAFYEIPPGVHISKTTFPKAGPDTARHYFSYNTHGVPTKAGSLELSSRRGRTNRVIVAINGRVRTE